MSGVAQRFLQYRLCGVMLAAAGLVACASDGPSPSAQIGATTQAIASAERAGALQFAPVELQNARDKLAQAQAAVREEENARARRLAEQALVDAELATARSQNKAAQNAAQAVREGIAAGSTTGTPTTGMGTLPTTGMGTLSGAAPETGVEAGPGTTTGTGRDGGSMAAPVSPQSPQPLR